MPSDTGGNGTPLAIWMEAKRVTGGELARRMGVSRNAIFSWSSGARRPGDDMKQKLAEVTLEIERELGITEQLAGVPITAWYPPVSPAAKAG